MPNDSVEQATKSGILDIEVISPEGGKMKFTNVLIFLVDLPNWKELLIGRPTLKKYYLLPEQNMNRRAPQLNDKTDFQKSNRNN